MKTLAAIACAALMAFPISGMARGGGHAGRNGSRAARSSAARLSQLLIPIISIIGADAVAQTWVTIHAKGNNVAFLDIESIKSEGQKMTAWVMVDWLEPQAMQSGSIKSSIKMQYLINCDSRDAGLRSFTAYSGHVGNGENLGSMSRKGSEDMEEPPPETIGFLIVREACDFFRGAGKLEQHQVLIGHDPNGLMTLALGNVEDKDRDGRRVGIVVRTFYWHKMPMGPAILSAMLGYVVNCNDKSILVRAEQQMPFEELLAQGKGAAMTNIPKKGSGSIPVRKWEPELIKRLCAAKLIGAGQ